MKLITLFITSMVMLFSLNINAQEIDKVVYQQCMDDYLSPTE